MRRILSALNLDVGGWCLFLLGFLVQVVHAMRYNFRVDDAYITFRYARNFAQGYGLNFNRGGSADGYTSFLHALLLGAGEVLGVPSPVLARGLGVIGGAVVLWAVALILGKERNRIGQAASILLIALLPSSACWILSGMETLPFLGILAVVLVLEIPQLGPSERAVTLLRNVAYGALFLSRPEAPLYFVALRGAKLLLGHEVLKTSLKLVLGVGVLVAPYYVWHLLRYSYLFPNTYYAKVSGLSELRAGYHYFSWSFLITTNLVLLLAVLASFFVLARTDRFLLLGIVGVSNVVATIVEGGDIYPFQRFLLPSLVCGAILIGKYLSMVTSCGFFLARAAVGTTAILIAVVASRSVWGSDWETWKSLVRNDSSREEVVKALEGYVRESDLLALNAAGRVPYGLPCDVLDMIGLNEAVIAHTEVGKPARGAPGHRKSNPGYVLRRRPDFLLLSTAKPLRLLDEDGQPLPDYVRLPVEALRRLFMRDFPFLPGDEALYDDPAFGGSYTVVLLPTSLGKVPLFVRNDHLDRFPKHAPSDSEASVQSPVP